ncbi:spore protease YyaC [Clostridium sp.]
MNDCFTLDSLSPNSHSELGDYLYIKLKDIKSQNRPIIFLCIGTDRATGDSLGPLIGYKLKDLSQKNIYIYGSLEYPIHSVNLVEILNKIKCNFKNPFIVGIDASLGDVQQIGKIFIEDLPLHPGLALNKNLPEVGEMNIKGVVNISGSLDFMMLQNTRLFVVMSLADCISNGIKYFINKCISDNTLLSYD